MLKKYNETIQRFGRSLLLPIGVMAPVGMVMGICGALVQSYMIARFPFLGNEVLNTILVSMKSIANIIFSNIPLLFAMGVAYGMSKKDKGIAAFSSVIGYLVLLITMNIWLKVSGNLIQGDGDALSQVGQAVVLGIQTVDINVFGGIIAGLIAAYCTDRFYNLELPIAFAFFAGKKSVPLITIVIMVILGLVLPYAWHAVISILTSISFILMDKILGPFLNITINRMLIPFGLHHVWNALIRFSEVGGTYIIESHTYVGILPAMNEILFNLGPDSQAWSILPELTRFEAQNQMVITLFAFPAIGLAIYKTAYQENKKLVKGLMITLVLTAMLGNVTEPLEFSFLFIAPILYIIYSLVLGVAAVVLALLGTAVGYLRGTIFDFAIFGVLYENSHWINIVLVGVIVAVLMYVIFKWYILHFNVKTPGREDTPSLDNHLIKEKRYDEIAAIVVAALGGKANMVCVENCITRLRIDLVETKVVDHKLLETSGCSGFFFPSAKHIHIVFGPMVEFVRNAVDEEMKK